MHLRAAQGGPIFSFLDFPGALRLQAPIPQRKTRTAHLKVICRPPDALDSNVAGIRARTTQETGDQAKGDSSTTTKSGKKNADSAATPKKTVQTAPPHQPRQLLPSVSPRRPIWHAGQNSARFQANLGSTTDPAGKQRRRGLGQHGLRRVSQARDALVWQDETGQVHDRSRRAKGRLSRGGSGCTEKEIELAIYASRLRRHLRF
jgi:hypothetical protein